MPARASKGKAKKPSAPAKKPATRNAPVKPKKNTRKRQASDESSNDDSSSASEGPSQKRKPRKRKKQPEVYDDDQSNLDIIPEEVEDEHEEGGGADVEPGDEVSNNILAYGFRKFTSLQGETEQDSGLEDRHIIEAPAELFVKKDTTKDLLTIFSDIVTVQFKKKDAVETVRGRWCLPCKSVQSMSK